MVRRKRNSTRITFSLVLIVFVYVVCVFPISIEILIFNNDVGIVGQAILYSIYWVHFMLNFIMYARISKKIRIAQKNLLLKCLCQDKK